MDTEHFSQQYFLSLSAAALSPPLLSCECLNFVLRGYTVLGALRVKVPRNTGGIGDCCGMVRQEGPGVAQTRRSRYCRTHGRHPRAATWLGKSSCAIGDPCKIPKGSAVNRSWCGAARITGAMGCPPRRPESGTMGEKVHHATESFAPTPSAAAA